MLQTGEDPGEIPKVPNIQIHGTRTAEITNILFPFLLDSCALHPTMKTIYHFYKETRDRAWEDQAVGLPPADLSCKMPLELHGIVPWPSSLGVSGDEGGQKKYSTQAKYFPF